MSDGNPGQIGRYQVLGELGRGGFGCVYRAFDASVGRQVAIKVLTAGGADVLRRFRNEAQVAGNLRHENVVTVYEYGEHEGQPFLAMEYLEGEDLHHILASHKPVTLLQKCNIMSQVAEGLECAHRNGVVHRDVKPANIMVRPDGRVKIMDFGIARVTQGRNATRLTQEGWVVGTLLYMAPEQFAGGEVDPLCDIFAYGVVYYELLTGMHPFQAPDSRALMFKISFEDPPPIRNIVPDCPEALERVIMRILHKDRELRYQSLKDVQFDTQMIRMELQKRRAEELLEEAQRLEADNQADAAQSLAMEALNLDPSNRAARSLRENLQKRSQQRALQPRIEALLNSGEDYVANRHFPEAVQRFEAAFKLDDENPAIRTRLDHARALLEQNKAALGFISEARKEFEQFNLTQAFRNVSEALRLDRENPTATELLARIQKEIDRRQREQRISEVIHRVEGMILVRSYDEAIQALTALGEDAKSPKVERMLDWLRTELAEQERKRRLQSEIAVVTDLLRARGFAEAFRRLEALQKEFPDEREPAHLLDYARKELEAEARARIIKETTANATALADAKDFAPALALLEDALQRYPGEAVFIRMLGSTLAAKADWERQQAIARTVRECGKLRGQQRFAEAIEMVEATLRDYSGDAELSALLEELEQEWTRKRRAEAARKAAEQASQMLDRRQFAEARQLLRQMLIQYPDETSLSDLLQRAEEELRAVEKARAIEAICSNASARAAAEDFDRALAVLGDGLRSWPGEGRLLKLRGEIADSRAQWARRRDVADCSERALKLAEAQKFEEAGALIDQKLREYPAESELVRAQTRIAQKWEEHNRREAIRTIASEARVLLSRTMPDEAADILKHGLAQYPGERELSSLAEQAQEAIRTRERARAIEGLIRESQELAAAGRYADARGVLQRGVASFPGDAALMRELASVKTAEEAWKREQAIAKAVADATKLATDGKFDEALQLLARSGGPSSEAAAVRRQIEQARDEQRRRAAVAKAVVEVKSLLDNDRPGDAVKLLDRLSAEYPGEPQWEPLRARAAEALAARKAAEERRRNVEEALRECDRLARQNRFDDAIDRAEVTIALHPQEESLLELRQRLERAAEERKRAEGIARAEAAARELIKAGRLADAIASLRESTGRFSGEASLRSLLAKTEQELAAREERQKAIEECRRLIESGRDDEALRRSDSALARFPEDAELKALSAKAKQSVESRRREEAIAALAENAIAVAKAREFDRALGLLKRGLSEWPGNQRLLDVQRMLRTEQAAWQQDQSRRQILQEIHQLSRKERFGEARQKADEALATFSADPDLLRLRKDCRLREVLAEAAAAAAQGRPRDALQIVEQSSSEFASAPEWEALKKRLKEEVAAVERKDEVRKTVDEARALADNSDFKAALALLDRASRQWAGEPGLEEARNAVIGRKNEHERRTAIENAVAACKRLEQEGRLEEAITQAGRYLRDFPADPTLLQLLQGCEQQRNEQARQQQRRADLAELQSLETKLTKAAEPARIADLRQAMQQIESRHHGDAEIASAAATLGRHFANIETAHAAASSGKFDAAIELSEQYLSRYPGHASFQAIHANAERARRAADLERIRKTAAAEPDLAKRAAILQDALARYPDEPWASGEFRITSNKLSLAEEIAAKARAHEASAEWDRALEEWNKLAAIYDRYPGLPAQMERVHAGRERARAEAVIQWTTQIDPLIESGELDKARQKLDQATRELSAAEPLLALGRTLEELQKKQRRIRDLLVGIKSVRERRNWEQVQAQAVEALALAASHVWLRKPVITKLTECAREVLDTDWRKAEEWLATARSAEPAFAPPDELARAIAKKKRAAGVDAALDQAKHLQAAGKRRDALTHLQTALREFAGEARLESARASLASELDRERARIAAELREIRGRSETAAALADLDALAARLTAVPADSSQDPQLAPALAEANGALTQRRRQLGRARFLSALGGGRGLGIAAGTAALLAAGTFGVVKMLTPAHPASVTTTSEAPAAPVGAPPASATPAPPVESKPSETPANTPPAAALQAALEIAGGLPQAKVAVDGRPAGEIDGGGRFRTDVAGGRHSIEISKDGYKPAHFEARFQAGGKPVRPTPAQLAMPKLPEPPVAVPTPPPAPPAAPKPAETKPVDTEPQDWSRVAGSGNIQDFQDYLRKHPGGSHERDAQAQIARIQQAEAARADQAAWDSIDKTNKAALQEFVARHGNSAHAADARSLLDGILKRETADAAAELKKKTEEGRTKADSQAVLRTLTDFEAAFNQMDLATMERLYNPMPAALREQFRGFKSVTFSMKPTGVPAVNGDTATVTCTRAQSVVAKQGGRFATPTEQVRVTLNRTGAGWIIREITRI